MNIKIIEKIDKKIGILAILASTIVLITIATAGNNIEVVNPPYPNNIDDLSKTDLIKAGFDKDKDLIQDTANTPLSIGDGVDNTILSWTTSSDYPWFGQKAIYYYGGDAAQSGDIPNWKNTWIETLVTGPGNISFYWSVSSESNYDYLEFYVDGKLKNRISGNITWQKKTYSITGSGTHSLRWRYVKDGSVSVGADAGFVDKVVWTGNVFLGNALDTFKLIWGTYGDAKWFGQTITYYYGGDAAKSGKIGNDQNTVLRTYVPPGNLTFYWKVSSEAKYDWLEFYIGNTLKDRISGNISWQKKSYNITGSGMHSLRWRYIKDKSNSRGADAGFVDRVIFKVKTNMTIISDSSTKATQSEYYGWNKTNFDDSSWVASKEIGQPPISPWGTIINMEDTKAYWIWYPEENVDNMDRFFRKTININGKPTSGKVRITADNIYYLYVNGKFIGSEGYYPDAEVYDTTPYLVQGKNVIAIKAYDGGGPEGLLFDSIITYDMYN